MVACHHVVGYRFVEPPLELRVCAARTRSTVPTRRDTFNSSFTITSPYIIRFAFFPSSYIFQAHRHSLHLAISDIDRECRIQPAPFWSLHELFLVDQKFL